MKKFKNVKGIKFTAEFEGNGCVNFDSLDNQKYFLNKSKIGRIDNDNYQVAKKTYNYEGDNVTFKYKVSSNSLRHAMWNEEMPFLNPSIMVYPSILYGSITQPCFLERGYVFLRGECDSGLKRKSPVEIQDAIEVGDNWREMCIFDFCSRSGYKKSKENGDEKDTTIFNIENVGNIKYQSKGQIDIQELGFIVGDRAYDRCAIDVDGGILEEQYLESLKQNFPTLDAKFGYYYIKSMFTEDEWAERGILLDKESVNFLVKDILKRILNIEISKRDAHFECINLKLTIIGDSEEEIIVTKDNLDDFYFEYNDKYIVADEEKIKKNLEKINFIKEKAEEERKEADKVKKELKKAKEQSKTENEE